MNNELRHWMSGKRKVGELTRRGGRGRHSAAARLAEVEAWFIEGESLTSRECLEKGWGNLHSKVHSLRKDGLDIVADKINSVGHHRYYIRKNENGNENG